MAYEHLILDDHTFTNEAMGGNFAGSSSNNTFLDFDKGTDFRMVTYSASI